nr:hypothetical protein ANI_1_2598074 [Aspergillus niger CBS 513.88]|eukprot:XP_001393299.2 hypothetical protein ANI_1_2598074 [Aspergillus niger CBS 513.88]
MASSETLDELKQAISSKISELEVLTRAAGDAAVSDHLKQISASKNQLLSLHRALVKNLKKPSKSDPSISERRTWFSNFISCSGNKLSQNEVEDLTAITKHWALGDTRCLKACAELWAIRPHLFCDGETPDKDVVRRCYNDLERMEDLDPTRRKALLVTLSRKVYERQEQLCDICSQLWDDPKKIQDIRRKRLARYSLFGWKWNRLTHAELILSFTQASAKRFELHRWTPSKIEALNAYTETLPQFAIRDTLHKAWTKILDHYEGKPTLHQTANPSSPVSVESAMQQTSLLSNDPVSTSVGLNLAPFEDIFASANPWLFLRTDTGGGESANDNSERTLSVDDIIASAEPWVLLHGADGNVTGPTLASAPAGPQNLGTTHTDNHDDYPCVSSGSSTSKTYAALEQSIEAASEA